MSESEILIGLAEIALGIAGFSGVIFALSPPEKRTGNALNALTTMVVNSVVVVVQIFFAIFLANIIDDPWGWASGLSLLSSLASLPVFFFVIPRVFGRLELPFGLAAGMSTCSFGQLLVHAVNLPIFGIAMFPVFFVAECGLLITALMTFVYLVIQLGSTNNEQEN